MIGLLFNRFKLQIAAGAAFIVGLFGIYIKGRNDANTKHKLDDANDYIETSERIDSVDLSGDDAEWLRNRAKRDGDL